MSHLKVLTVPDTRLRQKAVLVEGIDNTIKTLLNDMVDTMYAEDGAGLAGPQVGVNKRLVVIDLGERAPELGLLKMVNPDIIWKSSETKKNWEACLSVPDQSAAVERSVLIRLRYLDENNVQHEREMSDWPAICVQHEVDHLDGILYVDHLSSLKRSMILEKARKYKKK